MNRRALSKDEIYAERLRKVQLWDDLLRVHPLDRVYGAMPPSEATPLLSRNAQRSCAQPKKQSV
jgi:hypothetical protein